MTADPRAWFADAAAGFTELCSRLDPARLDDPALGDWSVRSLLGHTCRAFTTIESYLAAADGGAAGRALAGPVDYFREAFASLGDPAEVSARGVAAGRDLGDRPRDAAAGIAARVQALVAATPGSAAVATPVGTLRLDAYLPTRAFELTVHSLDLADALGLRPGPELERAAPPAVELAAAMAAPADTIRLLRAMTGRGALPSGFSVLR